MLKFMSKTQDLENQYMSMEQKVSNYNFYDQNLPRVRLTSHGIYVFVLMLSVRFIQCIFRPFRTPAHFSHTSQIAL